MLFAVLNLKCILVQYLMYFSAVFLNVFTFCMCVLAHCKHNCACDDVSNKLFTYFHTYITRMYLVRICVLIRIIDYFY